ncbi:glycosyltransferase family 4 protein [Kitasatospora cineracea]|uniref:Glycosyltransferase involved in cell wall biosynthesis n=1 Tax=Kitasatospora cineracea TaxID=88074 RepID=A0A8G1ULW5_9ACTN|nr:glycosyltransferase family 4 protein [Kitasatospora cineracea]ROR46480.1 glycosyltransferase involved in cell wall biosynthesis [Kitasatospora cineracea]
MTTPMPRPLVATCLDLPADSPGGSVELFHDFYTGPDPLIPARAFMLRPSGPAPVLPAGLGLLTVTGKTLQGPTFHRYVAALSRALAHALAAEPVEVLHLQHLAFGATPALLRALPDRPRIALIHGTDLLFAEQHRDQLQVLRESARLADAVVAPTPAMADHLLRLAPHTDPRKIHHIPWGVPDRLLRHPPAPFGAAPAERLRLLYAGRLTPEKGGVVLAQALAALPGIELSIAAPAAEFGAFRPVLQQAGVDARYLGWLPRPQLWQAFTEHDALAVPSTTLEAMGLVALEAQACGLPVLYQPVPGLVEALGASALAVDFTDPAAVARTLGRLRTARTLLTELRDAGRANAARHPLSTTATALAELGRRLG